MAPSSCASVPSPTKPARAGSSRRVEGRGAGRGIGALQWQQEGWDASASHRAMQCRCDGAPQQSACTLHGPSRQMMQASAAARCRAARTMASPSAAARDRCRSATRRSKSSHTRRTPSANREVNRASVRAGGGRGARPPREGIPRPPPSLSSMPKPSSIPKSRSLPPPTPKHPPPVPVASAPALSPTASLLAETGTTPQAWLTSSLTAAAPTAATAVLTASPHPAAAPSG
mmetsp:Transcript_25502/g.82401  ORF Transcript_25502/g.82401 Transcript_25502/m.82401 type:complete len:230 (-) Transcript_25502:777-1466(-)